MKRPVWHMLPHRFLSPLPEETRMASLPNPAMLSWRAALRRRPRRYSHARRVCGGALGYGSQSPCRVFPAGTMWLVMLVLLAGTPFAAAPRDHAKQPCAQWDAQFQQRLTPATLPTLLTRILAGHKGHGFASTFTEEKHIPALRRPLRSSGQLIFIPQHGLYRRLQTPFVQELLITSEALHQRQAQGATEVLPLDQLPVAQVFVEAFLALFSGSWETLQAHFQVYFRAHDNHWRLGLKPIHQAMAQVISCLILEGEQEHLRHLWVQETHGDVTHDHFMAPRLLAAEQWAAYRSQFEWSR